MSLFKSPVNSLTNFSDSVLAINIYLPEPGFTKPSLLDGESLVEFKEFDDEDGEIDGEPIEYPLDLIGVVLLLILLFMLLLLWLWLKRSFCCWLLPFKLLDEFEFNITCKDSVWLELDTIIDSRLVLGGWFELERLPEPERWFLGPELPLRSLCSLCSLCIDPITGPLPLELFWWEWRQTWLSFIRSTLSLLGTTFSANRWLYNHDLVYICWLMSVSRSIKGSWGVSFRRDGSEDGSEDGSGGADGNVVCGTTVWVAACGVFYDQKSKIKDTVNIFWSKNNQKSDMEKKNTRVEKNGK